MKSFVQRILSARRMPVVAVFGSLLVVSAYNNCSQTKFSTVQDSTSGKNSGLSVPSIQINNGDKFTRDTFVTVNLSAPGATEMYVTNDSTCADGGMWEPYVNARAWSLGASNQQTSVYAKFRDAEESTACVNASIIHDNTPPDVTVDTQVPAYSKLNHVSIDFHAADSLSGVDQLYCILPGQASALPCAGNYSAQNLADGKYLVQFLASDKAGNLSAPTEQAFAIDATPPVVTINSHPALLTGLTSATFEFSATDNLSGVKFYECKTDKDAAFSPCASPMNYDQLAQGAHKFTVHATDFAGNVSADASYSWTIDSAQPSVRFTQTPPPFSNSMYATFAFTGQDDMGNALAGFECRLNGGNFAACTSPDLLSSLSEGMNTFGLRGLSAAGVYSGELTYTWTVDLTAPVVTLTQMPPALTNLNSATFAFTVSESASGVAKVTCSLDGQAGTDCSSLIQKYDGLKGDMEHSFQVTAYDGAGNMGQSPLYKWYIDNTPPTVKIVSSPSALTSQSSATFQISGTDDHSGVTYQCALDNSTQLNPCTATSTYQNLMAGTHTFYAQAVDGAGNLSSVATYSWTIVTMGPVINFTQVPAPTILSTDQGVLSYTVVDSQATVTSISCMLDTMNLNCTALAATLTFPPLAAGNHTFTLTATNSVGLTSTRSYTFATRDLSCTTTLTQTKIPTKLVFVVDMSGSNQSYPGCPISSSCTDPGKAMRAGSIQQFFNDYGQYANFSWEFIKFQDSGAQALINSSNASTPIFSNGSAMQTAITTFEGLTDAGGTPYMSALNLATKAIYTDPDLNAATKPQYIVVFLSDGMPNGTGDTTTNILNQVQTIVNLAPGRVTFSTVYYGPVNATASSLLQSMATTGGGKFLNTNTNPTGRDFQIVDVINVPVTTCQ